MARQKRDDTSGNIKPDDIERNLEAELASDTETKPEGDGPVTGDESKPEGDGPVTGDESKPKKSDAPKPAKVADVPEPQPPVVVSKFPLKNGFRMT